MKEYVVEEVCMAQLDRESCGIGFFTGPKEELVRHIKTEANRDLNPNRHSNSIIERAEAAIKHIQKMHQQREG